jgi:multidrug resistance efflux pump
MSTTTAEFDMGPAQARLVSAPLGRDLMQATRRLAIKRFLLLGLVLGIGLAAACYGYRWWTVGRFIESTDDAYIGGEVTVIAPRSAG